MVVVTFAAAAVFCAGCEQRCYPRVGVDGRWKSSLSWWSCVGRTTEDCTDGAGAQVDAVASAGVAAAVKDRIVVFGIEDVDLLAGVVPFAYRVLVMGAGWRRLLLCRGGGSNIRRCVKSDQRGNVEGGRSESSGGW